jgi:hypothetical protein
MDVDDQGSVAVLGPVPAVMSDDAVMDYTQQMRMRIIAGLTKGGNLPMDVKEQATLMKALDGLDKQAIGKKRIVTENALADTQKQTARLINDVFKTIGGRGMGEVIDAVMREVPRLPDSVPDPDLVDGELDATSTPLTFDTFVARYGNPESAVQAS